MRKYLFLILLIAFSYFVYAQKIQKDTIQNYSAYKRAVTFSGLLQPRYTVSLTPLVDINGTHLDSSKKVVNNSVSLRRVRFNIKAQINDHFEAGILVNFAEFANSNIAGKVLENAFVRYTRNEHFHIIVGQFRPFVSIEDLIPADFLRSLDFSNGYTSFGKNGWESFQMGLALYGNITKEESKLPLRYYLGVNNGNGRTVSNDNDNTKHLYTRLEADVVKGVQIGANAGIGGVQNQHGSMTGADIKTEIPLGNNWKLLLDAVYKQSANFNYYDTMKVKTPLSNLRIKDFYVLPVLRYECNLPRLRSLEFSGRYEYLNEDFKRNGNTRQTITPMLGIELADKYFAYFQLGAIIDIYEHDIPKSSTYSHNTLVAQLQVRF